MAFNFFSSSSVLSQEALHAKLKDIVLSGDLPRLERLVRRIPDVDLNAEIEETHLIELACSKGFIPIVFFLISRGVQLNVSSPLLHSPLLAAAAHHHVGVIQLLLQSGADPALPSPFSRQSLLSLAPTLPWLRDLIVVSHPHHAQLLDQTILAKKSTANHSAQRQPHEGGGFDLSSSSEGSSAEGGGGHGLSAQYTAGQSFSFTPANPYAGQLLVPHHFVPSSHHTVPLSCCVCACALPVGRECYAFAAESPFRACSACFDLYLRAGLLLNAPLSLTVDRPVACRWCSALSETDKFTFWLPHSAGFLCSPCFLIWARAKRHVPEDRACYELREGNGFCDWCFQWFKLDRTQFGWIYPEKGILFCTDCWDLPFGEPLGVTEGLRAEAAAMEEGRWDLAITIALDYLEQQPSAHIQHNSKWTNLLGRQVLCHRSPPKLPHQGTSQKTNESTSSSSSSFSSSSHHHHHEHQINESTSSSHHHHPNESTSHIEINESTSIATSGSYDDEAIDITQGDSVMHLYVGHEHVPTKKYLGQSQLLGLYFAGASSFSSEEILTALLQLYTDIRAKGIQFDVIYVSNVDDKEQFDLSFALMPWAAVPYEAEETRSALRRKYFVDDDPTLVLLDSNQIVLRKNAHRQLLGDPSGDEFPWLPGPRATRFYTLLDWLVSPQHAEEKSALLVGLLAHAFFFGVAGMEEDHPLACALAQQSSGLSCISQVLMGILEDPQMMACSIKAHHPYALWMMGKIFQRREELPSASDCYCSSGLLGSSASCIALYDILSEGKMAKLAAPEALRWLARAEKKNCVQARARRGILLLEEGMVVDGLLLLQEAAELHGNLFAMTHLALYYEKADDLPKALVYHQMAADLPDSNAFLSLVRIGQAYEQGEGGLPLDYRMAQKYYQKAASMGYPPAVQRLEEIKLLNCINK